MLDDSDVFSIQADRNRPQRVFASACSGIYRSVNGAGTWTRQIQAKNASDRTYFITQDPQYENVWFAGSTHGIVRSTDGGTTWQRLAAFTTRSIAFDPGRLGRILIATDEAGILRSEDSGKSWQPANNGFCNRRLSPLWADSRSAYTDLLDGAQAGTVVQLSANLNGWFPTATTPSTAVPSVLFSPPWAPQKVLAKFEQGIYISEDTGRSWDTLDLPVDAAEISAFYALENPWIAAVGPGGILLSKDGKVWKRCSRSPGEVYAIISTRDRSLLAATSSGLKASADMGASWHAVRGQLETETVQAVCRRPFGKSLFAAKYGAIYTSTDDGRSWLKVSPDNWPVTSVRQLLVLPGMPDHLLVLTHQQGVWALELDKQALLFSDR